MLNARISRRSLFKSAGLAGAGLAMGSALSFGSNSSLLRQAGLMRAVAKSDESIQQIIDIAVTAEAMAVTLLGGALDSATKGDYNQEIPGIVVDILQAARAEEQFHFEYLMEAGAVPLTTTFTIPDTAILSDFTALATTIVQLETAFVGAYMAAARRFAELGQPALVKVAYQVAGVEAEHRVLANYALGTRPANDFAFYPSLFGTVGEAAQTLIDLGFIGGTGPQVMYPGPGDIDGSNVTVTSPDGPVVSCFAEDPRVGGQVLFAPLSGGMEVPGPGDSDGFGFAKIIINPDAGQLCFRLSVTRINTPTAAHIHAGGMGVAGDVVVPLAPPVADGLIDACIPVDMDIAMAILANPAGYYVNVHNESYPSGALRGQLSR
jgi:hypothetical protein